MTVSIVSRDASEAAFSVSKSSDANKQAVRGSQLGFDQFRNSFLVLVGA